MDSDHRPIVRQDDVRPSGQTLDVEPEAPTKGAKDTADEQLGLGTLAPDLRHPEVGRVGDGFGHCHSAIEGRRAWRGLARVVLANHKHLAPQVPGLVAGGRSGLARHGAGG